MIIYLRGVFGQIESLIRILLMEWAFNHFLFCLIFFIKGFGALELWSNGVKEVWVNKDGHF